MMTTIRSQVDEELTRRVGTWFTVRQIQDRLRINPSTLKPLIMKYARDRVLRRRKVKGTARSVEFSPSVGSTNRFKKLLVDNMPYRSPSESRAKRAKVAKRSVSRRGKARGRR